MLISPMPTFTHNIDKDNIGNINIFFKTNGFSEEKTGPYQINNFKKIGCNVSIYSSGKIVFQGNNSEHIYSLFIEKFDKNSFFPHIGSDEAGKGDFFGPLCVCACYVNEKTFDVLKTSGINESKNSSTHNIKKWAHELMEIVPYSCISIHPEKYNELYSKFNNLNKLLKWAHTKAIKDVIEKTGTKDNIIIDQFAKNMRFETGYNNKIIQETKAERYMAVKFASVIAKYKTIMWFEKKSAELGIKIPMGASAVKNTARSILNKKGKIFLGSISKKHFKTFNEIAKESIEQNTLF